MKRDLSPFLSNWDFDPTDICVRKIQGLGRTGKIASTPGPGRNANGVE